MTTLTTTEPRIPTDSAEHFHATLPPAALAALAPRILIPAEESFEAWEDGAYVLAYLRQSGLR